MITKIALFLILLVNSKVVMATKISPKTLEAAEKYPAEELQKYAQEKYKLIDPAGDYALLKRSELIPKRIIKALANTLAGKPPDRSRTEINHDEDYVLNEIVVNNPKIKNKLDPILFPEEFSKDFFDEFQAYCNRNPEVHNIYRSISHNFGSSEEEMNKILSAIKNMSQSIQGRENPVIREGMKNMFAQVINDERKNGIEPSYGSPHEWSPEFLEKHGQSSILLTSSKLLMALAAGETNRYMKTDKEPDLYKWLINQSDESVELSDIFRQSYKLNDGDIYKSLMTIENVLAHQWRKDNRDSIPFVAKLKPITSGHEYKDDRFGTWYHYFGIMLYGYVEGGFKASVIGKVEALGSIMLTPQHDKTQKGWINKSGGYVGGDLAELVKEKKYLSIKDNPAHLNFNSYVYKKEDFRDRLEFPLDLDIKATLSNSEDRTFIDIKDNKNRNLKNCIIEVIPDLGRGLNSGKKDTVRIQALPDSLTTFQLFETNVRKIRGFISCENSVDTIVFESL